MMHKDSSTEAGVDRVRGALGLSSEALLGQGGESWVFALDKQRVARVNRPGTSQNKVNCRSDLLVELGHSAEEVPFAIPRILDSTVVEGLFVTIERRLPGRPLDQVLSDLTGEPRASLVCAYLQAAAQIGDIIVDRPWYGDLMDGDAIRTSDFSTFLRDRAARSLKLGGSAFDNVKPHQLAAALPEPDHKSLVHLDAFPGNMLAEDGVVTAVLDFGASCIIGDRRLDPLTAAVYLAPEITPAATDEDRSLAQEWLLDRGLVTLYAAARTWIAAYWSFAWDDVNLHRWCQAVLLD